MKGNRSVQNLLGLRGLTDYGLMTDRGELIFFQVSPINISVLTPDTVEKRIGALTTLLSELPGMEVACLDAAESFELNKAFLHQRMEKTENPQLRFLLEKDLEFLDNIQIQMTTARQFLFLVRLYDMTPEQTFHAVADMEQKITGGGFHAFRLNKAQLKRMLAMYLDAGNCGDELPDIDGGHYLHKEENA